MGSASDAPLISIANVRPQPPENADSWAMTKLANKRTGAKCFLFMIKIHDHFNGSSWKRVGDFE
jgi:hypothetical protein